MTSKEQVLKYLNILVEQITEEQSRECLYSVIRRIEKDKVFQHTMHVTTARNLFGKSMKYANSKLDQNMIDFIDSYFDGCIVMLELMKSNKRMKV